MAFCNVADAPAAAVALAVAALAPTCCLSDLNNDCLTLILGEQRATACGVCVDRECVATRSCCVHWLCCSAMGVCVSCFLPVCAPLTLTCFYLFDLSSLLYCHTVFLLTHFSFSLFSLLSTYFLPPPPARSANLSFRDLCRMSRTCRAFDKIASNNTLWALQYLRYFGTLTVVPVGMASDDAPALAGVRSVWRARFAGMYRLWRAGVPTWSQTKNKRLFNALNNGCDKRVLSFVRRGLPPAVMAELVRSVSSFARE